MNKNKEGEFVKLAGDWDSILPFYIDKIVDGFDGIDIYVHGPRDDPKSGVFKLEAYYGYRNFNESSVWMHLRDIGVTSSGLFMAEQSELLDWAAKQAISEKVPSGVRHYIFASIEDIFEVLAFDEPSFKFSD